MPRPDEISLDTIRESFYVAVVCDVLDQLGFRHQSPRGPWPVRTGDCVLAGRCRTTLWGDMAHDDPSPYELELRAVDACQSDDVLIGAAGGSMRSGIWGELLTSAATNRGCVGAVIDGAVRDIRQMTSCGFPVWARGACPLDSLHRQRVVDIDIAVEIGGVRCEPGEMVLADRDGVVVIPRSAEAETLARAWDKINTENEVRRALREGMSAQQAFDRYGVL